MNRIENHSNRKYLGENKRKRKRACDDVSRKIKQKKENVAFIYLKTTSY